jgi:hypothetical protein
MRYRAILNDPVLQSAVSENAWVDVYQNVEQRIAVVRKPAKAIQGTQL